MPVAFNASEVVLCGGVEYKLTIDVAIIDEIEDAFDCSFDQLMAKLGAGSVRMGKMSRLIRGLLSREHPDITLNEVGALVFAHAKAFGFHLEKLLQKAFPAQTEKAKNPPKARRGTGANS
jgi:hypothetical protein